MKTDVATKRSINVSETVRHEALGVRSVRIVAGWAVANGTSGQTVVALNAAERRGLPSDSHRALKAQATYALKAFSYSALRDRAPSIGLKEFCASKLVLE